VVFVFSRASVLSIRISSFVQSRRFTVCFAIFDLQNLPDRRGVVDITTLAITLNRRD
jgi:hypothetical protein